MPYTIIPPGNDGFTAGTSAAILTTQSEASLGAEVSLGALSTGLLKISVAAGVATPSTAVANTDYMAPLAAHDVWKAEAAADLGIASAGLVFMMWGDGIGVTVTANVANGGARIASADGYGMKLQTGGGANGVAFVGQNPASAGATALFLQAIAGAPAKWWLKSRMGINMGAGGPVGAATVLGAVFKSSLAAINGTHDLVMGVDGAVSTTNFIVSATAGATVDSGIPIDALVRDHKVYRANGADTVYKIDSNSAVTGTARPNASSSAFIMAFDSAAVAQNCDVYAWAIAFPIRALGA